MSKIGLEIKLRIGDQEILLTEQELGELYNVISRLRGSNPKELFPRGLNPPWLPPTKLTSGDGKLYGLQSTENSWPQDPEINKIPKQRGPNGQK